MMAIVALLWSVACLCVGLTASPTIGAWGLLVMVVMVGAPGLAAWVDRWPKQPNLTRPQVLLSWAEAAGVAVLVGLAAWVVWDHRSSGGCERPAAVTVTWRGDC